jgi:hypothetical protein
MIVINYAAAEVILREGGLSFSQVKKRTIPLRNTVVMYA